MKFKIEDSGDMEVGIPPTIADVDFNDNYEEGFWSKTQIQNTKEFLAELYDIPIKSIMTEMEWGIEQENMREYEAEMYAEYLKDIEYIESVENSEVV